MSIRFPTLQRAFPWFKWTVYSLIALNVVLYFVHETFTEGLDSLAWLALLLLFEWETSCMDRGGLRGTPRFAAHAGRVFAFLVILYSAISYSSAAYAAEHGRLDTWNAWTWIAIVLVLEFEVRTVSHYTPVAWLKRNTLKFTLYGALFVYAALWGLAGDWLDFYDALLWILCFFAIEMNVLESEAPIPAARQRRT